MQLRAGVFNAVYMLRGMEIPLSKHYTAQFLFTDRTLVRFMVLRMVVSVVQKYISVQLLIIPLYSAQSKLHCLVLYYVVVNCLCGENWLFIQCTELNYVSMWFFVTATIPMYKENYHSKTAIHFWLCFQEKKTVFHVRYESSRTYSWRLLSTAPSWKTHNNLTSATELWSLLLLMACTTIGYHTRPRKERPREGHQHKRLQKIFYCRTV